MTVVFSEPVVNGDAVQAAFDLAAKVFWVLVSVYVVAALGCGGEQLDERQGAVETPISDWLTAGRSATGIDIVNAMLDWQVQPVSGPGGDAVDFRVAIGGAGASACKMRGGTIHWVNAGGSQTHQAFWSYDINPQVTSSIPIAVAPYQWVRSQVWTNDGGLTGNVYFKNLTTGLQWYGTKVKPSNCTWIPSAPASYIVERPVIGGIQRKLANFGVVPFANAWNWDAMGVQRGLGVWPTTVVTMQQGASTLAVPSPYGYLPAPHSYWSTTWMASGN